MINSSEIKNTGFISDVRAERLFRSAEDDLYYLDNPSAAKMKIMDALNYSPQMVKAIVMLANIYILEGNLDHALNLYVRAEKILPHDDKILAGLANIYELQGNNIKAFDYIIKALMSTTCRNSSFFVSMLELKSTILIKLNKYEEIKKLVRETKYYLPEALKVLQSDSFEAFRRKQELKKKMRQQPMKLV